MLQITSNHDVKFDTIKICQKIYRSAHLVKDDFILASNGIISFILQSNGIFKF